MIRVRCHDATPVEQFPSVQHRRVSGSCADGLADEDLDDLCAGIRASPTVVDLSEVIITTPEVVAEAVRRIARRSEPGRWCLVVSRLSGRRLLARFGVTATVALFATPADAVQALLLAADGYGPGWRLDEATPGARRAGALRTWRQQGRTGGTSSR